MTNPSKYFLPRSLSTTIAPQVALELASQVKPVCPPIHDWEDAGLYPGLHSLSGARFLLVMGHDPQLVGTGVPRALSPFFSFFLRTVFTTTPELSFSNRDLIISFSCLALLKHLLASLSACRARAQVQAWHRRPGTRWPQLRFNVTSSQSLLVPDSQVPLVVF